MLPFLSITVTVAFPLSSTNIAFASGLTSLILASIAFFSSVDNGLVGSVTATLSAGLLMLFPAFEFLASSAVFTKSFAGITKLLPSSVVIVAFPLSSTTTVEPGFTSSTAFLILAALSGSLSNTLSTGFLIKSCFSGFNRYAFGFAKSSTGIVAMSPFAFLTVAFPFASNTTVAPGLTSKMFFSISLISSAVNLSLSFTNTLSAGGLILFPAFTLALSASIFVKSATGIVAVFPSGVVTVAFPFSSTNTVEPGFTRWTFAAILALTSSVICPSLANTPSAGLLITLPTFGSVNTSSAVFTKSSAGITAVFPSGVVTVAFPFSSITTVAPGLTS